MVVERQFGWKRAPHDPRDYKYIPRRDPDKLPPFFSLRPNQVGIWDQGNLGSCVAHACNRSLATTLIRKGRLNLEESNRPEYTLSRLMTYYNARYLAGNTRYDAGAYIRDGIKGLAKWGSCNEILWPYHIDQFDKRPSWWCYYRWLGYAKTYQRVPVSVNQVKAAIADGFPVVAGFDVYESFYGVGTDGVVPFPVAGEQAIGGHAICYTGWDDNKKVLEFANSWGSSWGDRGYGFMPYDYIDPYYQDDFWIISD